VNSVKLRLILISLLLALVMAAPVLAQTISNADDGTTLKQIIIFGRHSIRAPTSDLSVLNQFSADPYPAFTGVPTGYLTPHGREAARLMGAYFRAYLLQEGLLTGNAQTDLARSYFRANSIQRSNITAAMFGAGLIPGVTIPVHSYAIANPDTGAEAVPDPVFDPILAGVAEASPARAQADVRGIYGSAKAITTAYSGELSLISSVLYPEGTQPIPGNAQGAIDPTKQAITLNAYNPIEITGGSINVGGLNLTTDAIDPFIMQYCDGFDLDDVAWGRLTPRTLSQNTRLTVLQMNMVMRAPYINQVQSSNAASHVLRSMKQVVSGDNLRGGFGNAKSRILVVISSDYYVVGLAGLLNVHWMLPGYQPDFVPPGGMLVFELRQSKQTKEYLVRVYFTSQKLSQLRNLTVLTAETPPATMKLSVPGGIGSTTGLYVKWGVFKRLMMEAIDQNYVQSFSKEVPPGVLNNVPYD
jgi:4-phytase / acid phosphatase